MPRQKNAVTAPVEIPRTALEVIEKPMISDPGIYDMHADEYHSDPCMRPSLSASIAKIMVGEKTRPAHARAAHPRLNPLGQGKQSSRLDLGTVCHTLALGSGRDIVSIPHDDFRTNAAKALRDEAYKAGKTPILEHVLDGANLVVGNLRPELERHGIADLFFGNSVVSEKVFIWREGDLWCRAMVDRYNPMSNQLVIFDYKTAAAVDPDFIAKQIPAMGYDVQRAHYVKGGATLMPQFAGKVRFIFLFQEIEAPFTVVPVELDGESAWMGERKRAAAAQLFEQCLDTGFWPSFPAGIIRPTLPPWAVNSWTAREQYDPLFETVDFGQ